jgi:hypothetical protein
MQQDRRLLVPVGVEHDASLLEQHRRVSSARIGLRASNVERLKSPCMVASRARHVVKWRGNATRARRVAARA